MSFAYKHVLMVGATSGIGKAMADHPVINGVKVTAVGRRQDRLDKFVSMHGAAKADSVVFDIAQNEQIPQFAADVMRKSPDIDCIFLNAGLQHAQSLSKPETFDFAKFNEENHVNYISFVALTMAFLPYLQAQRTETSFIFTGSNVAIVPAMGMSGYSASKQALNAFTLCLREELRETNVRVFEISPPPVQTDIHVSTMGEASRSFGMPVKEFTELTYAELVAGKDQIIIGSIGPEDVFNHIIDQRRATFEMLCETIRARNEKL